MRRGGLPTSIGTGLFFIALAVVYLIAAAQFVMVVLPTAILLAVGLWLMVVQGRGPDDGGSQPGLPVRQAVVVRCSWIGWSDRRPHPAGASSASRSPKPAPTDAHKPTSRRPFLDPIRNRSDRCVAVTQCSVFARARPSSQLTCAPPTAAQAWNRSKVTTARAFCSPGATDRRLAFSSTFASPGRRIEVFAGGRA